MLFTSADYIKVNSGLILSRRTKKLKNLLNSASCGSADVYLKAELLNC